MTPRLRLLLIEDNPADAELVLLHLRRHGFEPDCTRVESEAELRTALPAGWDVVLSDYELPQFDGMRALALVREHDASLPFILVSGTMGEERAVAAMKNGASDYLLKDRLSRLGPAVAHALEQRGLWRERDDALHDLRESRERFREVVETIHEVFWITDVRAEPGRLLYVSPGFVSIWGRPVESIAGSIDLWLETVDPLDRDRIAAAMQARLPSGTFDEEYRIVRPDGAVRWIHGKAFPVHGPDGQVWRVVGVSEDITARKSLEDQFLRAQRLEAIGTLAGGVAHDLNNILAPMLMAAGILRDGTRDERDERLLAMIEQSAHRGAEVIRQLLTFSRGGEGERVIVQLRYIVKEMGGIITETFPRDIALKVDVAAKLDPVLGNATQLHQVLMNLCVNARDAMPGGGELTLRAANVTIAEPAGRPDLPPGRYVMVAVADTGTGISPENLRRIFDPFFTTKAPGKGTGLGLATVQGIVKAHGGHLTVDSVAGQGTVFSIYLPPAEVSSPAVEPAISAAPQGAGETVLVVDDEPAILAAAKIVLERNGYHVLTACDGVAALGVFADASVAVDLVLTDVMMPAMGGVELVRALRARRPRLPIVATTGMAEDDKRSALTELGVNAIVDKPASPQAMLRAVHAALNPAPVTR